MVARPEVLWPFAEIVFQRSQRRNDFFYVGRARVLHGSQHRFHARISVSRVIRRLDAVIRSTKFIVEALRGRNARLYAPVVARAADDAFAHAVGRRRTRPPRRDSQHVGACGVAQRHCVTNGRNHR